MKVDFGATVDDYAKHRPGFPSFLFDKLSELQAKYPTPVLQVHHRVFAAIAKSPHS